METKKFIDWWTTNPQVKAWRIQYKKRFGEEPNLDPTVSKYDYIGAWKAGTVPQLVEGGEYHWPSRAPQTGKLLKLPGHPTLGKELNKKRLGDKPRDVIEDIIKK